MHSLGAGFAVLHGVKSLVMAVRVKSSVSEVVQESLGVCKTQLLNKILVPGPPKMPMRGAGLAAILLKLACKRHLSSPSAGQCQHAPRRQASHGPHQPANILFATDDVFP